VTARRQSRGDGAARDHGHGFEEMLQPPTGWITTHICAEFMTANSGRTGDTRARRTQPAAPDWHPVGI
jgi:hypothetical protein